VNPAFERGLPAAIEHEKAVLGSCLSDPQHLETATALVKLDDFSLDPHKRLWDKIATMHKQGQVVDRVTVAQAFYESGKLAQVGGMAAIAELESLPKAPGVIEGYCRTLRVNAIRRMAFAEAQRLMELSLSGAETETIISALQRAGEALSGHRIGSAKIKPIADIYQSDFGGDLGRLIGETKGATLCPIPWSEPLGGLRVGELTILAARPGAGKSSAASQIAVHVASGGTGVQYWSLEMKAGMILRRMVAGHAGVSHYKMLHGYCSPDEKRQAYKSLGDMFQIPLYMGDEACTSVDVIRNELRSAFASPAGGPSLVVVDYLQLLESRGHNRNEEVSRNSRGLKKLTLEFPVAVVALSQLSRDSEKENNREPRLSDLRDSGSLEQDADNVVFIHRPTAEEDSKVWNVQWIVRKQRNGHTGMVPLMFLRDQMKFIPTR
jgi:replicative DNA helicase